MSSIPAAAAPAKHDTAITVLFALSFCHFLNDSMQALLPAIYPILRTAYGLDFGQIGLITLSFQLTASILQPIVGWYTDRKPMPYSLAAGMACTGAGLLLLAVANTYALILCGAALVGTGSSIFHPESSRIARLASGGRHGFAQSVFQVGGNAGSAAGPLLAACIVASRGQAGLAWFVLVAILGMIMLSAIGRWYARHRTVRASALAAHSQHTTHSRAQIIRVIAVLLVLIFSKHFYMASLSSYYTFYLIDHFGVSVQGAQLRLFVFLGAVAAGTLLGGHIGDRIGRKTVIWFSILGILPFTLVLPHVNLFWTTLLTVPIGMILASAFPAIVVYAQELLPGKVGTIAGSFFGFAFGMGALGAALLGELADCTSIEFVYRVAAYLPALGIFAALLPSLHKAKST